MDRLRPAREVARRALSDSAWQVAERSPARGGRTLRGLLTPLGEAAATLFATPGANSPPRCIEIPGAPRHPRPRIRRSAAAAIGLPADEKRLATPRPAPDHLESRMKFRLFAALTVAWPWPRRRRPPPTSC